MSRRAFPRLAAASLAAALWLSGCATVAPLPPSAERWSGRLALTVLDAQGAPQPQSALSAAFELDGAPAAGRLSLTSPIGTTLAVLRWEPGRARLEAGGTVETYASLDELAASAAGAPIPVAALFGWLHGEAGEAPGWTADLSRLAEGRLTARRTSPPPPAELRVVLDR